ncbi:DUF5302 domain-containing protein [Streptomyces sp. JW3]|uniref:DUF5302 domain-containing protein n=1 Tax=Streptomyces sp. JW3 TaxID=3456955 RepID=UPI003FA4CAE1
MTDSPEKKTEKTDEQTEAKRKFQEALERKARASRSQQAHQDGRQKIKGLNGPKGQSRNFRRKSG